MHGQRQQPASPAASADTGQIDYLAHSLDAPPAALANMFQKARHEPGTVGLLHRALLQSIPGSSVYNPSRATSELRALAADTSRREVASVARVRLAEMKRAAASAACEQRLHKVIDIEKQLDSKPAP